VCLSIQGEAMDICVVGVNDRNRSLNGDRVAIEIRPPDEWKVLYETIKLNWHNWESEFSLKSSIEVVAASVSPAPVVESVPQPEASGHDAVLPDNQEDADSSNDAQENSAGCTEKTGKKKRTRKHNRSKKKKSKSPALPESESQVLKVLQPEVSHVNSHETEKSGKKSKKTKKKAEKALLVTENKSNNNSVKSQPKKKKSTHVNGLPRDLYAKTPAELMDYSFGPFCVQKTAKVVAITEKNHNRVAGGKISLISDSWVKFSPQDSRTPRILIPADQIDDKIIKNMEHNQQSLFLATITDWPADSKMPTGQLTQFLGESGDIKAESLLLLMENKVIDEPFSAEIEEELVSKYSDWQISSEIRAGRRDFSKQCVFTIDPATARDLDDALSIVPLDEVRDGNHLFEVGVHIADVSFFVEEGTPLDQVAAERSTSFYLVERVIPMLPRLLCEKLCSLTPGQEKLTFSVFWKMDVTGKIYETWFGRSIIKSCVKLAYDHAQQMIENPDVDAESQNLPELHGPWTKSDIKKSVLMLNTVAESMRKGRFDAGALKIDKVKFDFVLDSETGLPSGFSAGLRQEANFLVEEFMLRANMSVGEKILSAFPGKAILRRHPPPDDKQIRDVKRFCEIFGIDFSDESAGSIHNAMESLKAVSPANSQVISLLLLKSMKNALYFCSGAVPADQFSHYALNVPIYTHFTSPIRRYPDILVHRLLAAALGYNKVTDKSSDELHKISDHCNDRKQASRLVSEGSQKLFLMLYLQSTPLIEEAVVNNVLDRAFDVIVLKFGLVCRIYCDKLPLSSFKFDSKSNRRSLHLKWPAAKGSQPFMQTISMASIVSVKLTVLPEDRSKITVRT
jgi:DIS3-like exonuclease 2